MKCPKCQFENPEYAWFCNQCGNQIQMICPACRKTSSLKSKFRDACSGLLTDQSSSVPTTDKSSPHAEAFHEYGRKYVTILFSDLSGYTVMSAKLDPEEVKKTMTSFFKEIALVVGRYKGSIVKLFGDEIMAAFGITQSHEDDAEHAICAACEIHEIAKRLNPQVEKRIGRQLYMHTGISTGLAVPEEINFENEKYGMLRDTIDKASRLSNLARTDEIVVGYETYSRSKGHFTFEKIQPIQEINDGGQFQIYKLVSFNEIPTKTHRLSGLRAVLIGRDVEMSQLKEAMGALDSGKSSIISIIGNAGTGKSRLVEEFRHSVNLENFQWREGHAYAYTQNIPYFPLIDLLNRTWQIREGDSPGQVRIKLETGAKALISERQDLIPYVGELYSLTYGETKDVSPETYKARLYEAVQLILVNLCKRRPTILCIEDLHWADPSSIDLLKSILIELKFPVLFICIYRPSFSLFTSTQIKGIHSYSEIRLHDLSPNDTQSMVESLLNTENVPPTLRSFIRDKVEGNPFYLEEIINSLIETEVLIRDESSWKLRRPLTEKDIPGTVHGVITARLNRLERETKYIVQVASVIGRTFRYEILKRTSGLKDQIDRSLANLERVDLIRTRSLQPDLEYIFKHSLTQEVVYNGLSESDRRQFHEKIGLIMEEMFYDRLNEFYETLSYHFKEGQAHLKAVEYLMKAGEKSTNRYALEESNLYFQEAFKLIAGKTDRSLPVQELLVEILSSWSWVQYFRGHFGDMHHLLIQYKDAAELIPDKAKIGMFYAWIGLALCQLEMYNEGYYYLKKSLAFGEEQRNDRVIGYASVFLIWNCGDLTKYDEAAIHGERALELSKKYQSDHIIYAVSRAGLATLNFNKGIGNPNLEIGRELIDHGNRHSDLRSVFVGRMCCGYGYFVKGKMELAIQSFLHAVEISVDPFYRQWASFWCGFCYLEMLQVPEAEKALQEVISFDEHYGSKQLGTPGRSILGALLLSKGQLAYGLKMIQEAKSSWVKSERKAMFAFSDYNLGRIYAQLACGGQKAPFSVIVKNFGFLLKNVPFAAKKAESHFQSAIHQFDELGAKGWVGRVSLDLGHFYKIKGRKDTARKYLSDAISVFEDNEADGFLKQAKEALASLG